MDYFQCPSSACKIGCEQPLNRAVTKGTIKASIKGPNRAKTTSIDRKSVSINTYAFYHLKGAESNGEAKNATEAVVIAIFDFKAMQAGDLSLVKVKHYEMCRLKCLSFYVRYLHIAAIFFFKSYGEQFSESSESPFPVWLKAEVKFIRKLRLANTGAYTAYIFTWNQYTFIEVFTQLDTLLTHNSS